MHNTLNKKTPSIKGEIIQLRKALKTTKKQYEYLLKENHKTGLYNQMVEAAIMEIAPKSLDEIKDRAYELFQQSLNDE